MDYTIYMTSPIKEELYQEGVALVNDFCRLNVIPAPNIYRLSSDEWRVNACAYTRGTNIFICVEKCATIGKVGPAWSYPGYVIDRTPYGVLAHELGHYVDWKFSISRGKYFGDLSEMIRNTTKEDPITNYCPNTAEWFAEIFRLFCTNQNLLNTIRPATHLELSARFHSPTKGKPWKAILKSAPERTIKAAENKIKNEIERKY